MVFGKSIEKAKWDEVGLGGSNSVVPETSVHSRSGDKWCHHQQ